MKKYIRIVVEFERDGTLLPIRIIWDNGAEYPISKILDVRYFSSERERASGIKYTCLIRGKTREIFFDRSRWYVSRT